MFARSQDEHLTAGKKWPSRHFYFFIRELVRNSANFFRFFPSSCTRRQRDGHPPGRKGGKREAAMRKSSCRFLSFLGWAGLFEDSQRPRPVHVSLGGEKADPGPTGELVTSFKVV